MLSTAKRKLSFHRTDISSRAKTYIDAVLDGRSPEGYFVDRCQQWLETVTGCTKAFLVPSGTAALELSALLLDLKPSQKVILPSFTFPSTANAFLRCGVEPIFADIRPDTLNIDDRAIEPLIDDTVGAIAVVHYGGLACEMQPILDVASRYNITVVEDSAHAILCSYRGQHLGTFGDMGILSFHATKNITSLEGGVLLLRDETYIDRAEKIYYKGTNRLDFLRGDVPEYQWCELGGNFCASELTAALLYEQLERAVEVCEQRREVWHQYRSRLQCLETRSLLQLPPPWRDDRQHNGHIFYLLLPNASVRYHLERYLKERDIPCARHFYPLHLSPMGQKYGYDWGDLPVTETVASCLLRLPCHTKLSHGDIDFICREIVNFFDPKGGTL